MSLTMPAAAQAAPSAVLALFPSEPAAASGSHVRSVLTRLADAPQLALGMASASQAIYDPQQALLDLGQGARVQPDLYRPKLVPEVRLVGTVVENWTAVVRRAATAPAAVKPGLLASSVPGGGAFVGISGGPYAGVPNGAAYSQYKPWASPGALIAADRTGHIGAVSLGPPETLVMRTAATRRALTIVELSPGPPVNDSSPH